MSDMPRVVAAAILGRDGPVSLDPPARHHHIIVYMVDVLHYPPPIVGRQGFMLEDGTFADRKTARQCAEANNQLLPTARESQWLFSEDVW
jgi:hypothetical protein